MSYDFSAEYSERTDGELLQLLSARHSLLPEASDALDRELHRRNLTDSDRVIHQRFVKRQEQRETRSRNRKPFGTFKGQMSWVDIVAAFASIALVSFTYIALPNRYHLRPDWEESALCVMIASTFIVAATRRILWREVVFWTSLIISSAIHLFFVHAWAHRVAILSRGEGKGATLLGFVLFLPVYGFLRLVQLKFCSQPLADYK